MVVRNEVRKDLYLDSVALMRAAQAITALPGVEEAGLMIGTLANKEILREAGVLGEIGMQAGPGDLIIALRATSTEAAESAMVEARRLLGQPRRAEAAVTRWHPRTLRAAAHQMPGAKLALISVPGHFAAAEARKALCRGLNVMIFSDNVPLMDEVALKREARDLGLVVMGPDCGTAIVHGVPLGFANALPQGDVGIIGASGTGIQEVSCLIANAGRGISHAIGTGGRDLSAPVGGITTLAAMDLLDNDAATKHVVLISKPAAPEVAKVILARASKSQKPITVCFIGGTSEGPLPANVRLAETLEAAAEIVLGRKFAPTQGALPKSDERGRLIRGFYCGGTLCSEAQLILQRSGLDVASNAPIPGAARLGARNAAHVLIDFGDDRYTRGRPHPIIEPATRDAHLQEALADKTIGAILIDVILGWGSHLDPAGEIVRAIAGRVRGGAAIVASVTGTEADPQVHSTQARKLADAGVVVAPSNASATAIALECMR